MLYATSFFIIPLRAAPKTMTCQQSASSVFLFPKISVILTKIHIKDFRKSIQHPEYCIVLLVMIVLIGELTRQNL